ncbi:MAG: efflux RND transporter periplasmic adaptor subunit [Ignavibacteriales bacterium]|nr:efflux RND transporter periplasmic adaptor subunit [Ignavibacteriales bacterium]
MKKLIIYIAIGVVAVGGLGYYFLGNNKKVEAVPTGQVQRIIKVMRGDLNLSVSANGVVQPINKVEIKSKASGQILELNFVEGQSVKKGELLIALDQTLTKNDHDQAKADLALAEAALSQSNNNYKRAQGLFEKKLISPQELDQSKVDFVRSQSQLVKAKAALSSAADRLRDTRIVAPTSGVILTKNVDPGQIIASGVSNVGGGTILATVANMDEVNVETNVDEVDIGKVKVGQQAKVVADAYPDDSFPGEVVRIAPLGKTQQNVTTFNVIILVKNIGGKLKAGMSTSVEIEIFRRQQVLLVPNEALKDPRSEAGRALLASFQQNGGAEKKEGAVKADSAKKESADSASGTRTDFRAMREKMQNASPEERQKLQAQMRQQFQERMAKMSPEERQNLMNRMQQRNDGQGQGGGGFMMFGGGGDAGGGMRQRRESQVGNENEVKQRVIVVKDGDQFVPKIIKVGASNFDYSEVFDGLKEGDEIQITTVSRAKIAAEQMNDRMRSMQSMGGLGGGAARSATGTGGGGRR